MHGLLQDHATWKHRPDITLDDVTKYLWARASLGLPSWLRKSSSSSCSPPSMFPLVKSKCYADSGEHICAKPGHSCWRR
eukprot:3180456-Heterocapsa_arctica.AAC.1